MTTKNKNSSKKPANNSKAANKAGAKASAASKASTAKKEEQSKGLKAVKAAVAAEKKSSKAKEKITKGNLKKEVSKKAKVAKPLTAREKKRAAANAAIEEALDGEEEAAQEEEEEFDPEAFLAASGGKGLIRAHVMRKERVELSVPVRFRFLDSPLVHNAHLINLSKTGLCLEAKEKAKDDTTLRIEIPLPHTSELFAVQAKVVWCDHPQNTAGKGRPYHIGMNFLPMSLAKQTVINNFIQQRRDELIMAKIGLDRFSESVPVAGLD
jgi:hypothetical protein